MLIEKSRAPQLEHSWIEVPKLKSEGEGAIWRRNKTDELLFSYGRSKTFFHKNHILGTEVKRSSITSDAVAVRWKILVIPRWTSADLDKTVKTEESIWWISGFIILISEVSQSMSSYEAPEELMDFIISETASRRASIKFLSHKGWVTCKIEELKLPCWDMCAHLYSCSFVYVVLIENTSTNNVDEACCIPNVLEAWNQILWEYGSYTAAGNHTLNCLHYSSKPTRSCFRHNMDFPFHLQVNSLIQL